MLRNDNPHRDKAFRHVQAGETVTYRWDVAEGGLGFLVGKSVVAVEINAKKNTLVFRLSSAELLKASAHGDCCSRSWFEHLNGLDALTRWPVLRVIKRAMPGQKWDDDRCEATQFYGWTIETAGGRCDIEMRNESNGYYGGWVSCEMLKVCEGARLLTEDF